MLRSCRNEWRPLSINPVARQLHFVLWRCRQLSLVHNVFSRSQTLFSIACWPTFQQQQQQLALTSLFLSIEFLFSQSWASLCDENERESCHLTEFMPVREAISWSLSVNSDSLPANIYHRDWVKAFRIQAIYMFGNGYARSWTVYDRGGFVLRARARVLRMMECGTLGVIRPPRTQPTPPLIIDLPLGRSSDSH